MRLHHICIHMCIVTAISVQIPIFMCTVTRTSTNSRTLNTLNAFTGNLFPRLTWVPAQGFSRGGSSRTLA